MNLRDMGFRDVVSKDGLRRPPLRVQLTVLYAGLFLALVAAVLGVSGFLVRHRVGVAPVGEGSGGTHVASSGHSFEVWPAIVGLVAVLVAAWLAWWIAGRFLRPLQAMNTAAQEISATNLHRRLSVDGPNDELTQLGRTLDDLFARLEASFESQRHFVANASHELRTPLAGQRTLLQVALADPDASTEDLRAACDEALQLGAQQERLIDALLTLATSERGVERREPFDLDQLAESVLNGRQHEAERLGINVDAALGRAPAVGDPRLVESLVANLVDNALRHNITGGQIEISTTSVGGAAYIAVRNTGPLIPPAEVDRLFQPFQQIGSERVRHTDGHGLGLAIVQAIAQAHGANVTARARPEGGLDVEVTFSSSTTHPI
jgi:signal transduction histidine kinase